MLCRGAGLSFSLGEPELFSCAGSHMRRRTRGAPTFETDYTNHQLHEQHWYQNRLVLAALRCQILSEEIQIENDSIQIESHEINKKM